MFNFRFLSAFDREPLFERPLFRRRPSLLVWTLDRLLNILMLFVMLLVALFVAMAPARAQTPSTIFLTDRNGQVSFPFAPPNRATNGPGSIDNMTIGANVPKPGFFTTISSTGRACTATPCVNQGLNAAQGGSISQVGGTSSTSANNGGNSTVVGGTPGITGGGGLASVTGGPGGSTSGGGGAAALNGGAATTSGNGGIAQVQGGTGAGGGNGGQVSVAGGASTAGATGNGGNVGMTGGASGATNGSGGETDIAGGSGTGTGAGGAATLTGGAAAGSGNGGDVNLAGGTSSTGVAGVVREKGVRLQSQGAQATQDTAATLTAAQILTGIITSNPSGAVNLQLPLATAMDTALPTSVAGDSFDFTIISLAGSTNLPTVTTNTGWTLVGAVTFTAVAGNAGRFRAAKTGTGTWTLFRLS